MTKKEVYLIDYLLIPAKHCRMILVASMAVTVVTYLLLFISPNEYTASCRILPPQQNVTLSANLLEMMGGGINYSDSGGSRLGAAAQLLGLGSPDEIYVSMLSSNTVADWIIERFNLQKVYNKKELEDVRITLRRRTKISLGKDRVIKIEVSEGNPKLAADLANAYLDELNHLLQELGNQEARDRYKFLEKELVKINANLSEAEEALRSFGEKKNIIQIDAQTKGTLDYVARLRAEIDAKEVQVKVLRKHATPSNFDVIRLETELNGLREKLRDAEIQWDQTVTNNLCVPSSKVPALGLEYLRLMREIKFQENLYQIFIKMVEIARIDMVKHLTVVQALDRATPPVKRSNKRLFPALVAGMATFFIMIFVAFGKEYVDRLGDREEEARRLSLLFDYLRPHWWKKIKDKSKFGHKDI